MTAKRVDPRVPCPEALVSGDADRIPLDLERDQGTHLIERLWSDTPYRQQVLRCPEWAMLLAIVHYPGSHGRTDARQGLKRPDIGLIDADGEGYLGLFESVDEHP